MAILSAASFNPGSTLNLSGSPAAFPGILLTYSGSANGTFGNVYLNRVAVPSEDLAYSSGSLDILSLAAGPSIWSTAMSGSWSTGLWTGGTPNGVAAGAIFNQSTTAAVNVALDSPVTLGTLQFANSATAGAGYMLVGSNTLTLSEPGIGALITVSGGSHGISAPVQIAAGNLVVSSSGGGVLNIASNITDDGGQRSLTLAGDGSGQLILSGSNSFGGGLMVNAGTLSLNGGMLLTNAIQYGGLAGSAKFNWSSGTFGNYPSQNLTVSGLTLTMGTAGAHTVYADPAQSTTFDATTVLAGSGNLNIGGGLVIMAGANTFTGNITLNGGTLATTNSPNTLNAVSSGLGNQQAAGRTLTVNNGSTLFFAAGNTNGNGSTIPKLALVINQGGQVVSGNIAGNNVLGSVTLNGGTLSTGSGFRVNQYESYELGGTVTVGGSNASTINIAAGTSPTTIAGINLGVNAATGYQTTFNVGFTGAGGPDLTVAAQLFNSGASQNATGLIKTGPGMMVLTAANLYTGTTTVNQGTLQVGNALALGGGNSAVAVNGGELDLNGNAISLPSLSGSGGMISDEFSAVGSNVLTVAQIGVSVFGGTIRDGHNGTNLALTLNGPGTLQLSGSNTYSGDTNINGGILSAGTAQSLSTNSNVFVNNNAVLDATAGVQTVPSLTIGQAVLNLSVTNPLAVLGAANLNPGSTLNLNGAIASLPDLLMTYGTANGTFSNVFYNGFAIPSGDMVYSSGSLEIVGGVTPPSIWASAVNGTWSSTGSWTSSVPNGLGAAAAFIQSTTATVTVTLDTPVTLGTLQFANSASGSAGYTLGGSNALAFSNSAGIDSLITVVGGSHVISAPLQIAGGNLDVNPSNGGLLTISNAISDDGSARSLTVGGNGSGQLILSGSNSYGGSLIVNAGTLILNGGTAGNGSITTGAIMIAAGANGGAATFNCNGGTLRANSIQFGGYAGLAAFNFNGGMLLANVMQSGVGTAFNWSGGTIGNYPNQMLTVSGLTLTMSGTGVHTLYSDPTQSTTLDATTVLAGSGDLNVSGGLVTLAGSNTFTGNITVSGGTLQPILEVNTLNTVVSGVGNPQVPGRTMTINNGGTFLYNAASGNVLGSGTTVPLLSLVINAGGMVASGETNGNNTLGALTLNGGTLITGQGQTRTQYQSYALGGTVTAGGNIPSTITFGADPQGNGINLGGTAVAAGYQTVFNVGSTGAGGPDLTVSAQLFNSGGNLNATGLIKTGPGTMALTASNAYTGRTTVNQGTLQLGNSAALGGSALVVNGGELDIDGNAISLPSLSGSGGAISDESSPAPDSPTVLTIAQGVSASFAGTIRDGLSGQKVALTMNGSGMLVLSGTNTYSGGTTVVNGTLVATSPAALRDGSSLTVGNPSSFGLAAIVGSPAAAGQFASSVPALQPVPEPGTVALLAAGLAMGFGVWRAKRQTGGRRLGRGNIP